MNQHQRWTQDHITRLREGILAGDQLDAIAAMLDRRSDDVQAMMNRLRLTAKAVRD